MSSETKSTTSETPRTPRYGSLLPQPFHWPISVLLEDLPTFFEIMGLSKGTAEAYVNGCTKHNITNVNELRERASIQFLLDSVGISSEHVFHVMRKVLFFHPPFCFVSTSMTNSCLLFYLLFSFLNLTLNRPYPFKQFRDDVLCYQPQRTAALRLREPIWLSW